MKPGLLAAVLLLTFVPTADHPRPTIPWGGWDFKQYYAVSQLLREGKSPYDHAGHAAIQHGLGVPETEPPQVPYGPPTTLLPYWWPSYFDYPTAVKVNIGLNAFLVVVCAALWTRMFFPQHPGMVLLCCVGSLMWFPTLCLFGMGQNTGWPFLGLTGWAWAMARGRTRLAGLFLPLTIIKPHLMLVPLAFALVYLVRQRRWETLLIFVAVVGVALDVTILIRPTIWSEYLAHLPGSQAADLNTATLDGWGRSHFGTGFRWVTGTLVVACALAAVWLALRGVRDRAALPVAVAVACVGGVAASPYAFSYDYTLLLPGFLVMLGHAILREERQWPLFFLGWAALDGWLMYGKVIESRETIYALVPWGASALTVWQVLPVLRATGDVRLNGQGSGGAVK
jgi:hypothetical protein